MDIKTSNKWIVLESHEQQDINAGGIITAICYGVYKVATNPVARKVVAKTVKYVAVAVIGHEVTKALNAND